MIVDLEGNLWMFSDGKVYKWLFLGEWDWLVFDVLIVELVGDFNSWMIWFCMDMGLWGYYVM